MRARSLTLELEGTGPFGLSDVTYAEAREQWGSFLKAEGFSGTPTPFLGSPESNVKIAKSAVPTFSLTLAPADLSEDWNVCNWSTPQCRAACVLVTAGKARFPMVIRARIARTRFLGANPRAAIALIAAELKAAVRRHGAIGCRLNVGSDLRWERIAPSLLQLHGVTFYDYTKAPADQRRAGRPAGYRLTYSVSERPASELEAERYVKAGGTAAVVFATKKGHALPATYRGIPVIDGDLSDYRPSDPAWRIVGLRAKGDARGAKVGGFVKADVAT